MGQQKSASIGRGTGWSVGRATLVRRDETPARQAFTPRIMPDGTIVHELDRDLHERALGAARRVIRGFAKRAVPQFPRASNDAPCTEAAPGPDEEQAPETPEAAIRAASARIAELEAERDDYKNRLMCAEVETAHARAQAKPDIDETRPLDAHKRPE